MGQERSLQRSQAAHWLGEGWLCWCLCQRGLWHLRSRHRGCPLEFRPLAEMDGHSGMLHVSTSAESTHGCGPKFKNSGVGLAPHTVHINSSRPPSKEPQEAIHRCHLRIDESDVCQVATAFSNSSCVSQCASFFLALWHTRLGGKQILTLL